MCFEKKALIHSKLRFLFLFNKNQNLCKLIQWNFNNDTTDPPDSSSPIEEINKNSKNLKQRHPFFSLSVILMTEDVHNENINDENGVHGNNANNEWH